MQLTKLFLLAVQVVSSFSFNVTFNDAIRSRCKFSDSCYPSQEEMSHLSDKLQGTLYLPHMEGYRMNVLAYNTYEQRYPSLIAMVKSANDVQEAILWARKYNLHVTIRSSGHCYLGRSSWDGSFNINLAWMKDIEVNLNSARSEHGEVKVQTGNKWIDIYKKVNESGRVVVGGSAHTVSPGGYTLGGGHSPISRSHGYAVDNVLEFQIVLPDGQIATCTATKCDMVRPNGTTYEDTSGDLFWAVRGGGGNAFGVVIYFVYKLHRDVSQVVVASGDFPFKLQVPAVGLDVDLFDRVFGALGSLVNNLPREWGGYWLLDNSKVSFVDPTTSYLINFEGKIGIYMNKFGPWDGTEEEVFSDLLQISKEYEITFGFHNKTGFFDYEKDIYDPPTSRSTLYATLLQNSSFNASLGAFLYKEMFDTYRSPEVMGCTFIMLGGNTTVFPINSTPLHRGYRTARASLTCGVLLGAVSETDYFQAPEYDSYFLGKVNKSAAELRLLGDGMYFNEAAKNNPEWKTDYWNDYPRLLAIKKKFDPTNFLTCHQCVGSDEVKHGQGGDEDCETNGDTSDRERLSSVLSFIILVAVGVALA